MILCSYTDIKPQDTVVCDSYSAQIRPAIIENEQTMSSQQWVLRNSHGSFQLVQPTDEFPVVNTHSPEGQPSSKAVVQPWHVEIHLAPAVRFEEHSPAESMQEDRISAVAT
jgi:hypothetical protein